MSSETVANRLKLCRTRMNLTQEEFSEYLNAKKIPISRTTIAKYETGARNPSERTIRKLANALDVDPSFLRGDGIRSSDVDTKLTNLLHEAYFTSSYNSSSPISSLHDVIKNYLLFDGKLNKPLSFYQDTDGNIIEFANGIRFPLYDSVKKFWKDEFSFLFENEDFRKSVEGDSSGEFTEKVSQLIKNDYEQKVINRNLQVFLEGFNAEIEKVRSSAENYSVAYRNPDDTEKMKSAKESLKHAVENTISFLEESREKLL